jgi:hypothetical protein
VQVFQTFLNHLHLVRLDYGLKANSVMRYSFFFSLMDGISLWKARRTKNDGQHSDIQEKDLRSQIVGYESQFEQRGKQVIPLKYSSMV